MANRIHMVDITICLLNSNNLVLLININPLPSTFNLIYSEISIQLTWDFHEHSQYLRTCSSETQLLCLEYVFKRLIVPVTLK